jgi:hypothetical protein
MQKPLHIGKDFALPLDFVTQTQAILAKKRVGKSYTASVQAEELLKAGQQIAVVDPTGAWWGLKSSADGKHEGFPIAVFGGEHADVPLEEGAGETVAQALVEQRFSAILDLTLFRKGQVNRFMTPFLETLYRLNRQAMHLFVDEADAIAPQKPFGEEARMLGAMEDVVRRGGIRGIGTTLITQRPAVLNKNVLTQCEILCALRIVHHKDIDAIHEWIEVHGDPDLAKQMIDSLPSLPIGTAWFWAPGWGDLFERVEIRQRETFDSGATPKPGETKRTAKVLASVDLQKLGEQIQATVQRAKENDPKALKAEIARLRRDLAKAPAKSTPATVIDERAVNRAVSAAVEPLQKQLQLLKDKAKRVRQAVQHLQGVANGIDAGIAEIADAIPVTTRFAIAPSPSTPAPVRVQAPTVRSVPVPTNGNAHLSNSQRKVLSRLVELLECTNQNSVKKEQLAAWAEYSPTSGGYNNLLGALRSSGLIDYPQPGMVAITNAGRALASPDDIPASSDQMREHAKRVLGGSEARLLDILHRSRDTWTKEQLGQEAGFSHTSGGFNNYLGHMRTLGFVEYPAPGQVKAAAWLYLEN